MGFLQFFLDDGNVGRIEHRVTFSHAPRGFAGSIASGVPPYPINWTRAPNGWLYFTNGLMPLLRWNGIRNEAVEVGVPAPATACTIGFSGAGSITGTYDCYVRYLDELGNPSNLSPVSNEVSPVNAGTITYTSVPVPTDRRVVRKQILRNTTGQRSVYYVDVDTTDVGATSLSSTRTDTLLGAQTAVPLVDFKGNSLALRYGIPRNDKPIVISYYDRLFMAGSVTWSQGCVEVTFGSTTVQGVGTDWVSAISGRQLDVVGGSKSYTISSVNTDNQTLTLSEAYNDPTDLFAAYTVRSAPAIRNTIYYTQSANYDAWSEFNGITVREEDDDITAMWVSSSFLYIAMKRKIHRLTFHRDVIVDGGVFVAANRGCVNNRCWVSTDGVVYALDEEGVYAFDGTYETRPLSVQIQDLFNLEHLPGDLHINWDASRWFWAQHHREEHTVRWHVALAGQRLPRHAICYNHRYGEWWLEEYPVPLGHGDALETQVPRPLVAGPARRVFAQAVGTLDGPNPKAGTCRGTVTSATWNSLTDSASTFPASNVAGWPVAIVGGRGKGQVRIVHTVSSTTLRITRPWTTLPDTTSTYQLGGLPWSWKSRWLQYAQDEKSRPRRIELKFQPTATPCTMDVRYYRDHAEDPSEAAFSWPSSTSDSSGWTATKGSADYVVNLQQPLGYIQIRSDDGSERYVHGSDYVQAEMRGFSCDSTVRIYEVNFEGTV